MSEIDLFRISPSSPHTVEMLTASRVNLEKDLQILIENNMEQFFGVKFLKSEYAIKDGRMDSIGIDENNCPVIFEYKRNINENVINQGLFYLDWLLDHKGDFELLVMKELGASAADDIDWSAPCVICIANDFTKYDLHAVNQMQRNIKLVRYRKYGDGLILFEHLNAPSIAEPATELPTKASAATKTHTDKLSSLSDDLHRIYDTLCEYIESFGGDGDITSTTLKKYIAYKKQRNFACIALSERQILLYLKLDPNTVDLETGFSRDVSSIGHYGTGHLEITIRSDDDLTKAKPLIERAYNEG